MDAVGAALRRYVEEGRASATGQIKVAWHVISNGSTGNVAQSAIDAQIAYMNQRYAGTGFSFVLASVDRTSNNKYFGMTPGSRNETKLHLNPIINGTVKLVAHSLNPNAHITSTHQVDLDQVNADPQQMHQILTNLSRTARDTVHVACDVAFRPDTN